MPVQFQTIDGPGGLEDQATFLRILSGRLSPSIANDITREPYSPVPSTRPVDYTTEYQPNLAAHTAFTKYFLPASTITNTNDNLLHGCNRNAPRERHCDMLKRNQLEPSTRTLPSLSVFWDEQDPAALINVLENCGKSPTLYQSRLQEQTTAGGDKRKKFDPRAPHFDVVIIDLVQSKFLQRGGKALQLEKLPLESLAGRPGYLFVHCGATTEGLERGRELLKAWQFRRIECICWLRTNSGWQEIRNQDENDGMFRKGAEWSLLGIKGTAKRTYDAHLIHCNTHADVHISGNRPNLCYLAESFSLGLRRLYVFGSPADLRPGWITVGRNIPKTTFDCRDFLRRWEDRDSWLLPHDPEIEYWRPKTPPEMIRQRTRLDMKNKTANRDDHGWGKGPFYPHPDPTNRSSQHTTNGAPPKSWGQSLQERIDLTGPPKTIMEREFLAMMGRKSDSAARQYTDRLERLRLVDNDRASSAHSSSGRSSTPQGSTSAGSELAASAFFPAMGETPLYPAQEQYNLDNQATEGRGPLPPIKDIRDVPLFWRQPGDHPSNTPSPPLVEQDVQKFMNNRRRLSSASSASLHSGYVQSSISSSSRRPFPQAVTRPALINQSSLQLERMSSEQVPTTHNMAANATQNQARRPFSAGPRRPHPVFETDFVLSRANSVPISTPVQDSVLPAFWRKPSTLRQVIVEDD